MRSFLCVALLAAGGSVCATELPVTLNGTAYTLTVDDGALWQLQRPPVRIWVERSTVPSSASMPDGTVWMVAPDGSVWVDARRTAGNVKVAMLTLIGRSVYGKGLTDGKWWRWSGMGWVATTADDYVTALDPPARATASSNTLRLAKR